jgi:signal transduction histidine kinase
MINSSGRHLLALINDMLDLSRIEAGRLELNPEPVDTSALMRDVLEMVTPAAEAKGLELRIGPLDCDELVTDRTKLRQILLNLLDNAVKYTDAGTVTLCCVVRAPRLVAFSVDDTGPGISPEDRDRIFGDFTRVLAKPGAPVQGTGLGLAIARSLAGALGGMLTLDTTLGTGSTFTVTLPATMPAPSARRDEAGLA